VPTTSETEIKELKELIVTRFDKLENKVEKMAEDVVQLKVDMATVKTKLDGLDSDVKDIKGTQKAQIWTLITTIMAAILGILVALGRFVFLSANP
jgi:t-SNARE complex subunit (syntaxin)